MLLVYVVTFLFTCCFELICGDYWFVYGGSIVTYGGNVCFFILFCLITWVFVAVFVDCLLVCYVWLGVGVRRLIIGVVGIVVAV